MTNTLSPANTLLTATLCQPDRFFLKVERHLTHLALFPLVDESLSKTIMHISVSSYSEPRQVCSHSAALPGTAAGVLDSAGAVSPAPKRRWPADAGENLSRVGAAAPSGTCIWAARGAPLGAGPSRLFINLHNSFICSK